MGQHGQIIQATPNLGSMEILFYHLSHVLGPVIINMSMLVVPAVILLLWVNKIKDEILFQYKMLLAEIKEKPIFSLLKALCFTIPLVVIGLRFYSISTHTLYDL
ncbi:MAG: hypothetical protein HC852_05315 [Acaryochloridaceae cyanobacterium RU_4_10]|nr:hypothetical protein [Acaryochloridaceae cyanobacterium RU_4_10]